MSDCGLRIPLAVVSLSKNPLCSLKVSIEFKSPLAMLDRLVPSARQPQNSCIARVNDEREWFKLRGAFERYESIIEATDVSQQVTVPLMRMGITWIEFNRPLKFPFGSQKIPIVVHSCPATRI